MTKKLNAAAAQDLIERELEARGGKALVAKAKPVVAALLELLHQSSRAAGQQGLSITGISVKSGDEVARELVGAGPYKTPVDAKQKRLPIAYGDYHQTCHLVVDGDSSHYVCTKP